MNPRPHDYPRTLKALTLGAVGLLLSSCAVFHPQRIQVATRVTTTLPPSALGPGASGSAIPGSNSRTVFVPGSAGALGGKPNYASAPGVTTTTINLGIIVPLDGPAAQLGRPLYRATQAYVNALNARGGIHGRLVQLFLQTACINCEDENLLAAKALVEQKHVFAIVNTYMNTYAFGAALNYLNQQHVPLIEGWSGIGPESETWSADQTPWNVYYTVRNEDGVQIFADWLDTVMSHWAAAGKLPFPSHPHWVATVGLDVTQDRKRAAEFKRVWESKGAGYQVVAQEYVAAQEEAVTRMDSFVSAMKNAQANGAFSASNITMVFGMQAASRNSWHVPWVSKSAWGKAATDTCGAACNGGFTDNNGWGWSGIRTPQMKQYLATMERYYPEGATYADAQTLGGWIGMMAFEYAATQLGADLTRPSLVNILGNLHNFDTGIGAPINTSSSDHLGMGQTMMLQICNNKFWRVTNWLSPGGSMGRVANNGDCGWGW